VGASLISDSAYDQIKTSFDRDKIHDGAFAMALTLYQKNFEDLVGLGKTEAEAEATLLTDITITSLKDQSIRGFQGHAKRAVMGDRAKEGFGSAMYNIFLNVVGNVVFIVLSVVVYLTMQDTAKNFFSSMGFLSPPAKVEQQKELSPKPPGSSPPG